MKNSTRYFLLFLISATAISCGNNKSEKQKEQTVSTSKLNAPLAKQLEDIYEKDQAKRRDVDATLVKHGINSTQMDSLMRSIGKQDSVNIISVSAILDKYGWPGPDVVGETGSAALFIVVQHADRKSQAKYLPLMRKAVKEHKALPGDLAKLEDRVALDQGQKQIYGTQFGWNAQKKAYYLYPIIDPTRVNERRAEMNMGTIEDGMAHWKLKWNPNDYK